MTSNPTPQGQSPFQVACEPTDEELLDIWASGHLPTDEELEADCGENDLQFLFTSAYYRWLEENPEEKKQHEIKCLRAVFNAGARWAHPAAPPPPSAEALAARPLLEKVARMGDRIGAHTVAEITAISDRAAAWLRENPPGQPVAIEPRGCPTPGACSCVEPTPPTVRYEFLITDEHGQVVAGGDAATLELAEREGRHYLGQYRQDGACTLELRRAEVLKVSSPEPEPVPAPAAADPPLWRVMAHAYDNAPAPSRDAPDDWTDRVGYAAEILAVRDRVVPEEPPPVASTDCPAWLHWQQRQAIRARLTAEAARAERGE